MDWKQLQPLPRVMPFNKGRRARDWARVRDEYAAMPKAPLIITARLVTPVIYAERDQPALDGILSFAVFTAHPVASDYTGGAVIPLPVELAWVSPGGQPLWACTPLMPADTGMVSREYWHKRYPSHRAEFGDKLNAVTAAGRWKEYRVPVRTESIDRLHACAIGNAGEIEALLALVTHIGKMGGAGYGRVASWTVSPGAHTLAGILSMRLVPVAYYSGRQPVGTLALNRGWTPPYWYAPWWADCMVPDPARRAES